MTNDANPIVSNAAEAKSGRLFSDMTALFGDNTVEFEFSDGTKKTFVPDETKGYFQFALSHAFPAGTTAYGTGLHPQVIANSYRSLENQMVNYEHQLKLYHKEGPGHEPNVQDKVLGCVVAVDFPRAPHGGWKVSANGANIPAIKGVGVFFKNVTGMNKIVGDHQTSRHNYTVSMEVDYNLADVGIAIARSGIKSDKWMASTPDEFKAANYDYVPINDAPDDLLACFSMEKSVRVVKKYKGRQCHVLMGGSSGKVHYAGVGVVRYGAEPTAKITRMAAGLEDENIPVVDVFSQLADLLVKAGEKFVKK